MSEHKPVAGAEPWNFAGWGTASRINDLPVVKRGGGGHGKRLGEWAATAICGNDITSSCLYVSALCAAQAGRYAPVALGMVALVLFIYRRIYAEVGSALPLNGGTYTVLLNTTNKKLAAAAACLTLLSYVATAVISASEAMHYAHHLWEGINITWATIGLLGLFAFLNVVGISESAVVAIGIFAFHMLTLVVLSVASGIAVFRDPSMFLTNWSAAPTHGLGHALFFGFAAGMLGISGFESSANFIEEQEDGVFPKTLRNMWIAVAVFNPLISLLSLGLVPLAEIQEIPPDLLAQMGTKSWGLFLADWVSVDAVLVLSGAVLTSYVGVTGLIRRMSLDRCLPQLLLARNRLRGTNHWIILAFFLTCCSILLVTTGEVSTLAGVYTLSFLSVMALFAVGNMLLKTQRSRLPRAVEATWPAVTFALIAVLMGLAGNVLIDPTYVRVFGVYFAVTLSIVGVMFLRLRLLRMVLFISGAMVDRTASVNASLHQWIHKHYDHISSQGVLYFTKGDNPTELNRAALYVLENEQTQHMTVVHVYPPGGEVPPKLAAHLKGIDHLYPQLRIDLIAVEGDFGPPLIDSLSEQLKIPKNYMFIGTPGDYFPHRIDSMGGVRLIL